MNWLFEKRDKFVDWFRNTGKSIADYFQESKETLTEWVNYKPGGVHKQKEEMQPLNPKQSKKQELKQAQQQPVIQRGLVNRIEIKFEKSDQERER